MRTEREKMLAGVPFNPFDPELVSAQERAQDLCQDLNATREAQREERRRIVTELFGSGGEDVWLRPPFLCDFGSNIYLGKRCFFNFNCVILDVCRVEIGDYSIFGPGVHIYTAVHPMDPVLRRQFVFGKPVSIGSSVWVGGCSIIHPGVKIGSRSVIGAGSIVTKDIPEDVFAAGNPCQVIRELPQSENPTVNVRESG